MNNLRKERHDAMKMKTRIFGEVDIDESKIIHFVNGIIGFPNLTEFALIHDEEKGSQTSVRWLQSLQEEGFAMPVIDPLLVMSDYNPQVEDELLKPVGSLDDDQLLVLVTLTVPCDLTKMTVNLKAPIVVNAAKRKACQIVAEGDEYVVKYPIYDILHASKKAGD